MKTKILSILILAITFITSTSFAQNWYIGITAGPTFSNYKTKTPWKEVSNIGYAFGATAYKQTSANFGMRDIRCLIMWRVILAVKASGKRINLEIDL